MIFSTSDFAAALESATKPPVFIGRFPEDRRWTFELKLGRPSALHNWLRRVLDDKYPVHVYPPR